MLPKALSFAHVPREPEVTTTGSNSDFRRTSAVICSFKELVREEWLLLKHKWFILFIDIYLFVPECFLLPTEIFRV